MFTFSGKDFQAALPSILETNFLTPAATMWIKFIWYIYFHVA